MSDAPEVPTPSPQGNAPLTGACMCGAVRFEVTEPLLGAAYCHCKRCQRRTRDGVLGLRADATGVALDHRG